MSLLPYLFDDSSILRPSRILDQHFGIALEPEDLLQPLTVPNLLLRSPAGYVRAWRPSAAKGDTGSTVHFDKESFQALLDVQQFNLEDITVKVTGNHSVTVEGKHEEKQDEHGKVYRHFLRRYILPKNCDMDKIESKLSSDGVLTITAPRLGENQIEHKTIPITQTGEPAKQIEETCDSNLGKKCEDGASCCKK